MGIASASFVDTNVLVYLFDQDEPAKQERARALIATEHERLVLSTQVLGEFYVVSTRKLGLPEADAAAAVDQWSRLRTVAVDSALVTSAVKLSRSAQLSYWDALILAAAGSAGCERVLTEDLSDGSSIGGVLVENPFSDA